MGASCFFRFLSWDLFWAAEARRKTRNLLFFFGGGSSKKDSQTDCLCWYVPPLPLLECSICGGSRKDVPKSKSRSSHWCAWSSTLSQPKNQKASHPLREVPVHTKVFAGARLVGVSVAAPWVFFEAPHREPDQAAGLHGRGGAEPGHPAVGHRVRAQRGRLKPPLLCSSAFLKQIFCGVGGGFPLLYLAPFFLRGGASDGLTSAGSASTLALKRLGRE